MVAIIEARKDHHVEQVFSFFNRQMLSRHFNQLWIENFSLLTSLDRQRPVIFYANHSNWWDGLLAFHVSYYLLNQDGYLMMMAQQLKKYRFFRWIGAFGVDRTSAISAYRSLQYAAGLLNAQIKDRPYAVWIFPQGELLPNDIRPLKFQRGLSWLISQVPQAQLVSVAFRYEFLNEQLPEIFISFRIPDLTPLSNSDRRSAEGKINDYLQSELTVQLDELRQQVISRRFDSFQPFIKGKTSINVMYDKFLRLIGRAK